MVDHQAGADDPTPLQRDGRLDSWKKIGAYLKRDVSTVQRWERREGMPVHRHQHDKQGSVFAFRSELDAWWNSRPMQVAKPAASDAPPTAPNRGLARSTIALAAIAGLGVLAWLLLTPRSVARGPLEDARYVRISALTSANQAAAISPDGEYVAFIGSRQGQLDAWVGEIGSGTYRNVTNGGIPDLVNPSVRTVSFSPDSSLVTVWSRKPDGSQPSAVSLFATPVRGGGLTPYLTSAAEFAWSPDGRRLVYHTTAPGDPIFLQEDPKSAPRLIYAAAAGVHCHYPVWSPDGEYVYFVRGVPPDKWDIWRVRPSGAGLERITQHDGHLTYPVMLDARTLLYLLADVDGSGASIYSIDVEQRTPHRISSGLGSYTSLSATSDGTRLVATVSNPQTSLWRLMLPAPEAGESSAPAPTLLLADASTPRMGPDFLVFVSSRSGGPGLWTLADGVLREIWRDPQEQIAGAPTVAADGRIAFVVQVGGRTRLLVIDRDGSHLRVLNDSLQLRGDPAWTPDGKSVVVAALQAGEPRLMLIALDSGPPQPLVSEYALDPVWSPDGSFLVFTGADIGTTFPLRAAAADGRPVETAGMMLSRGGRRVGFAGERGELLVTRGEIGHKNLWLFDLHSGAERELAELPPDFVMGDFDVSRSGTEVVFERVEDNAYLALIERPH